MQVIIVSEEVDERKVLRQLLQAEYQSMICLEASNSLEATRLVKKYGPQFLFLDMRLFQQNNVEAVLLLAELSQTKLILLGTETRYALDAFRLRAFYYLLQPIQQTELAYVVQLMKQACEEIVQPGHKLPVEYQDGITYIDPKQVVYISKNKENKTVSIYTVNQQYISTYTLQDLEKRLVPYYFLRVHKSYLINLLHVTSLQPYYNGTYNLYVEHYEEPLPVSRNYVKILKSKLEI